MILTTHNLTIGYTKTIIAHNLNLSLLRGELVCLLGPNGAGKSTLMRTLAAMHPPLSGEIRLMGQNIRQLKHPDLATRLSVVLTDRPDTGQMCGYELVALGRHPYTNWSGRLTQQDQQIIQRALALTGATDLANQPVAQLSDGQRQKIMIARALAQDTPLILLDEPTAFLDLPRRVEIMRLLRQLARQTNRAILLSTHDLDLALRTADQLWLMAIGGIIQTGAPEDLVLNGAFQTVFQNDGLFFDLDTGAFRIHDYPTGKISVHGEGIRATWARRAVERIGYTIVDDAPLVIEVLNDSYKLRGKIYK
ncbi:MAG: ABC transporter ATP-binding protein, partial [Phototrophicales bacterium]